MWALELGRPWMCWRCLPKLLVNMGGSGKSITCLILLTPWTLLSLLLLLHDGCAVVFWEGYSEADLGMQEYVVCLSRVKGRTRHKSDWDRRWTKNQVESTCGYLPLVAPTSHPTPDGYGRDFYSWLLWSLHVS